MPEGLILAFDFGLKHIGVATGQTITRTADALTSISAKQGIPDWNEVTQLIKNWKPSLLVVGIPLNMDGTEQPITHSARKFLIELKQRYHLPVESIDERLSTVEARSRLFEQGGYKALTKKAIDATSAKLILEQWLAEHS